MDLELALELMGLTNQDFTYMQLTKTFVTLTKGLAEDDERLEQLSDAYDLIKRNFKNLKKKAQLELDDNIYPQILPTKKVEEHNVTVFPVIFDKNKDILSVSVITDRKDNKKIHVLTVKSASVLEEGSRVTVYDNGNFYSGVAEYLYE